MGYQYTVVIEKQKTLAEVAERAKVRGENQVRTGMISLLVTRAFSIPLGASFFSASSAVSAFSARVVALEPIR
jgi:hypothetical protein